MIARRVSLITGIYLFAFVIAHLCNLSLGLISIDEMDKARSWLILPWANPIGGGLLLVCVFVHMCLGLRSLYRRNTLRLAGFDLFQLLLGLIIPVLMLHHMISMSMLPALANVHASYHSVLTFFWVTNPWSGLWQVLGLLSVWLHGCMGLFVWMRLQPWWKAASALVYPTVVLLPTLALLGFVEAGKATIEANALRTANATEIASNVSTQMDQTTTVTANAAVADVRSVADGQDSPLSSVTVNVAGRVEAALVTSAQITRYSLLVYLAMLALTLVARLIRLGAGKQMVSLTFEDGQQIEARGGVTVLEISRLHDIPHASLCGGKGRCGTCQVQVLSGAQHLTPKTPIEVKKLTRIGADSNVRLACQAKALRGAVEIRRLLPGFVQARDIPAAVADAAGEKAEVAS